MSPDDFFAFLGIARAAARVDRVATLVRLLRRLDARGVSSDAVGADAMAEMASIFREHEATKHDLGIRMGRADRDRSARHTDELRSYFSRLVFGADA